MLLKENIPVTYALGKIRKELILVAIYSLAIYFIHQYYNFKEVSIPLTVPTILCTIISLLLAFRSNQAYDRWWEARILWGAIVNDCRTFTRAYPIAATIQRFVFVRGGRLRIDSRYSQPRRIF